MEGLLYSPVVSSDLMTFTGWTMSDMAAREHGKIVA
jgi:hypothetical protein